MSAAAAGLLGLQVPSAAPVFVAFLSVHVTAALTCVICGVAAALSRKGLPRHIRWGRVYYWSLAVVFATAIALAAMRFSHDWHLAVIGIVAFTAATAGFIARRRRWPGDTGHITGMGVSYIALLTAFYVDNGKQLPLWDRLPVIAYWLLPALLGTPLVLRAVARHRTPRRAWTSHARRGL